MTKISESFRYLCPICIFAALFQFGCIHFQSVWHPKKWRLASWIYWKFPIY